MPMYEVEHCCALSEKQQDALAEAITDIHSEQFGAVRLFVNVRFTDVSEDKTYIAGKKRQANRIVSNVRNGPSRTQEAYKSLCSSLEAAWHKIVGKSGHEELRMIFILGDIVAGMEAGFALPQAGEDQNWLKVNLAAFRERAESGDEDFKDVLREIRTRPAFKGISESEAD